MRNKYISNFIYKIYFILINLISSIFLTRYMGPEIKGEYGYIINTMSLISLFLNFGIYQSYLFNKRKGLKDINKKYLDIFVAQFLLYAIISLMIYFKYHFNKYVILLIMVPIEILRYQISNIIFVENINFRNKTEGVRVLFQLLTSIVLYFFMSKSIIYIVSIKIILDILMIFLYLIKFKYLPKNFRIDMEFLKSILGFGFYPMLTPFLITINYKIDVIFLKRSVSTYEIGLYVTGVALASYAWVIPDIFKEVLYSKVSKSDSIKEISLSIKLSLISIYVIVGVALLIGENAIEILYGKEFIGSYKVMMLLLLGVPGMIFYKLIGIILSAKGKLKFNFYTLLISALINVILNVLLIPMFGTTGAALASIASYLLCGFIYLFYFKSVLKVKIFNLFYPSKQEVFSLLEKIKPNTISM